MIAAGADDVRMKFCCGPVNSSRRISHYFPSEGERTLSYGQSDV